MTHLPERFWPKVQRGPDCWLWTASRHSAGYGQISINNRPVTAHRVAWELTVGPVPAGMDVCHTCDNRLCVNPAHLFLGTRAENMADMARKYRGTTGERNRHAKLTDQQVIAIRAARAQGESRHEVAARFGVSPYTVKDIERRKTWTHV